jgi:DnaK suppressor protein
MDESWDQFVAECKRRLLKARQDRLNGMRELEPTLKSEVTGDEGDMAQTLTDQHTALTRREKMVYELREIAEALGRIENGGFGVCEETEEPIERQRLLALPWTRLSLIGAEIRESRQKRFA